VACGAIRAILSIMLIFMAGNTLGWSPLINAVSVTFLTFQFFVLAYQWKSGVVVIERHIAPLGGLVTGAAIPVYFGVGSNTTQRSAWYGIQRTRAEHHAPTRKGISRDGKSRDEYGNHASPGETAQAILAHSPLFLFTSRK